MKFVRYRAEGRVHHGRLHDDGTIERLVGPALETQRASGERDQLAKVKIVAPVDPPRVFGVGLNYAPHAKEAGQPVPQFPMLFMKPPTAVIGPEEPIVYPRQGKRVDYECELAVVIGRKVRRVPEAGALDVVFGYTCANDVSERSIQFAEMKTGTMVIGKSFDTFCPLGPAIVTGIDPGHLDIATRLNGEVKQQSNTADLIFGVAKLVAYLSAAITLLPGDVIITGTPAGIGPMQPGDVVEIDIQHIGVLRNPVVAE
jgi:2-keto-4-pentenoate hydratase/2-oxohepta-3-ene-1,7-dioic acid hydratase in catechol pathway